MAETKALTPAAEQKPKKRGGKSASVTEHCTAKREEISQIIRESYQFFSLPPVRSDEECAERLNWYFQLCAERGRIPAAEDMALSLGVVRQTFREREQAGTARGRNAAVHPAERNLWND